jgi:hypothetical protein
VMLDEKMMGKVAKGEKWKKKTKNKNKKTKVFLYVERAWNQKKLRIGD